MRYLNLRKVDFFQEEAAVHKEEVVDTGELREREKDKTESRALFLRHKKKVKSKNVSRLWS